MIDAVGASPHNVFVAAMLERALLAPGHRSCGSRPDDGVCVALYGHRVMQQARPEAMGGSDICAAPAILDAQRPMRPTATRCPAFTLGGAEAALSLFARESSGTALRRGAVRGLVLDEWRARRRVETRLLVSYTASCFSKTRRRVAAES